MDYKNVINMGNMRKKILISMALLALAFALYSFSGYKIWTEQDLVTTSIEDEIGGYTILDSGMFRFVYPRTGNSVQEGKKD